MPHSKSLDKEENPEAKSRRSRMTSSVEKLPKKSDAYSIIVEKHEKPKDRAKSSESRLQKVQN